MIRREWEHGWFEMESAAPHATLAGHVRGEYLGWTEQTRVIVRRREVAGTVIPLILNFGEPYQVFGGADDTRHGAQRTSFAAGLYDTWAAVEGAHRSCALKANLTPFAAHALFRIPLSLLHNSTEEFTTLLGAAGARLIEQLGNAIHWPARFALLDSFLRTRLGASSLIPAEMQRSWAALARTHGRVPIVSLVADTGWSARRLIAEFRTYVGMRPGTVAGVHRFSQAIAALAHLNTQHAPTDSAPIARALMTGRTTTERMTGRWSTLALDCGYADQSHFTREFVRFSGCTPSAYLRGQLVADGGVIAPACIG